MIPSMDGLFSFGCISQVPWACFCMFAVKKFFLLFCFCLFKFIYFFYLFLFSTLSRTSLVLLIGVDSIRVVMKDGRTCQLSFEDKELQDLLHWQVWTLDIIHWLDLSWFFLSENNTKGILSWNHNILHFWLISFFFFIVWHCTVCPGLCIDDRSCQYFNISYSVVMFLLTCFVVCADCSAPHVSCTADRKTSGLASAVC
jgi:hypothetical protein